MKQDFIRISSGDRYYLLMPDAFYGNEVEIHVFIPKEFAGKFVRIEVVNDPIQNKVVYVPENKRASEMDLAICHIIPFQHSDTDPYHPNVEKEENISQPSDTIPGHPNCHYGDCWDCHVVSCGIYQGYEDMPVNPNE